MQSKNLPVVEPLAQMSAVIVAMTESRTGLALVMDNDRLKGIITDGDLRRYLFDHQSLEDVYAKDKEERVTGVLEWSA